MKYSLKRGSNILTRNGDVIIRNYIPPTPPISEDLMFLYLANDFDGTKIPNRATNGLMGDYLKWGTITKNGSGSSCYLSNDLDGTNYLYTSISTTVRDLMRAFDNTFTYYVRVYNRNVGTGGIISWRSNFGNAQGSNYCYMIRTNSEKLEVHFDSGVGLEGWLLDSDKVYKLEFDSSGVVVTDLSNNNTYTIENSTDRGMSTYMFSFVATCNWPGQNYRSRTNFGRILWYSRHKESNNINRR